MPPGFGGSATEVYADVAGTKRPSVFDFASASQIAPSGPSSACRGCVSPGFSVEPNTGGDAGVAR